MTTSMPPASYFNLHINGLGYLSRIRDVQPKKGDNFLACAIAALNGPTTKPEYRYFDVRVSGDEAQHLIRRCNDAVDAGKKVLIGFRLGDLWTDIYTHTKGKNAGKQDVSLKARLIFIHWIKIDGEQVYQAKPKSSEQAEDIPPEAPASTAYPDSTPTMW